MNEDEAFMRAIVDSPGDNTARLAYADWLDDRADPRGKYLRAENEWAATHDPSERDALRQLAKTLDPVWVARVSRPALGVCCDHVRFTECGPRIDTPELDRVQLKLGVQFPAAYRAFLLNYNAGMLTPLPATPQNQPSEPNPLFCFYPIGHSFRTAFEDVRSLDSCKFDKSDLVIVVGIEPTAWRIWFLGVGGDYVGKVYSDCLVKPEWLSLRHPRDASGPGLPEFLGTLVPSWARQRQHEYDI
jgi:uncharacterized protein (TIGR02996 family)